MDLRKKSATDTFVQTVETVSSKKDHIEKTVAIFLDLAKNCNSVSHNHFLKTFERCGFPRKRKNCCFHFPPTADKNLNGTFPYCEIMNHVAPQRTFIGPLIFFKCEPFLSSFINTTENISLFSDDTSVVCCGKKSILQGNFKEILQKLNNM